MMTDKPMIFSAPMVRALLDGRKTQTRRVLKPQPEECSPALWPGCCRLRYAPGDLLWVREAWQMRGEDTDDPTAIFQADPAPPDFDPLAVLWRGHWRSPIHMPRWASRLTLHVTDVRVQRVREISEADAFLEGIAQRKGATCRDDFRDLWDTLNAKRGFGWDANPWVVVLTFAVERANIDALDGGGDD